MCIALYIAQIHIGFLTLSMMTNERRTDMTATAVNARDTANPGKPIPHNIVTEKYLQMHVEPSIKDSRK